jgi:glycerol-3-phosphate dehydrogenase
LREAAQRGLSAVLVERGDFAGGASANSLKIIHGGVRYLQGLDLPRIRASAREQRFFLRQMPHLVQPLACFSPTRGYGIQGRGAFQAAFWAYSALCADILTPTRGSPGGMLPRGRILPPQILRRYFPGLDLDGQTGTALWYDAIALDTERVVLELITEACENGAQAFNYAEMGAFMTEGSRVTGIEVRDCLTGATAAVAARQVVLCTGEASRDLKNLPAPAAAFAGLDYARAVNVVVDRRAAPGALALRSRAPAGGDRRGRLLFFVPWRNATMIGTWYFPSRPREQGLSPAELDGILAQINAAFPRLAVGPTDITFVHMGRLPADAGETRGGEPRLLNHGRIIDHNRTGGWQGLWSVLGVKYTTARRMAEKVLRRLADAGLRPAGRPPAPRLAPPHPAPEALLDRLPSGHGNTVDPATLGRLVSLFGGRTPAVIGWTRGDASWFDPVPGAADVPRAALGYALHHESAWHLSDLLLRRSNIGAAARPAPETVEWAADLMGRHLGWDAGRRRSQIAALQRHYDWWKPPGGKGEEGGPRP